MARFNPPPGWPDVPDGWAPPPGWQPDPHWPRPPADWQWWLADPPSRPRRRGRTPSSTADPGPVPSPAPRPGWGAGGAVMGTAVAAAVVTAARPARRWETSLAAALSRPTGTAGLSLSGAALVIVIGSLLPWLHSGARAVGGVDGDGVITLTFGGLLVAAGIAAVVTRWPGSAVAAVACAAACGAVSLIDIATVASAATLGAVGVGLWITLAGAGFALAAAVACRRRARGLPHLPDAHGVH